MESFGGIHASNHSVYQTNTQEKDTLSSYSERDKPWDTHRANSDEVSSIYSETEHHRLSERIAKCSGVLRFAWVDSKETGESRLKLREARFCRVRYCPVCQWRRSLMYQAQFHQALPMIAQRFPNARWLFLTLTVRNCPITDLRETLSAMNKAWQRLIKRKDFAQVQGWIRTTEVTQGDDGSAHPHFHVLLMVPPSYFSGRGYMKQADWTLLWQETMRLNYTPVVDIRAIKSRPGEGVSSALQSAIAETLKYSVKESDMVSDHAWFLELTKQTHQLRFIATGGALKDILKKEGKETDEDMIIEGEEKEDETTSENLLAFRWRSQRKHYMRYKNGDSYAR